MAMAQTVRFIRWIYDESMCSSDEHGGHYYLIPTHGLRVLVAVSKRTEGERFEYKATRSFRLAYTTCLNLVGPLVWQDYCDFRNWLNAQVHNSFVRNSTAGSSCCWFLKQVWGPDVRGYMTVPSSLWPYMECPGRSTWVLLRLGSRVWPIEVLNGRVERGWKTFRKAHGLHAGQTLILGCERKWLFDVTVLDTENNEIRYPWTTTTNIYWQNFSFPQSDAPTACLPSLIYSEKPVIIRGLWSRATTNYLQEFQQSINVCLEDPFLADYGAGSILITMGDRNWIIPLHQNTYIDVRMFNNFIANLELRPHDYLFIAILPGLRAKIIVFDQATRCERLYNWLDEDLYGLDP